jgi:hypothetical protein
VAAPECGDDFVDGGALQFWGHAEDVGEGVAVVGVPGEEELVWMVAELFLVVGALQELLVVVAGGLLDPLLDELGAELVILLVRPLLLLFHLQGHLCLADGCLFSCFCGLFKRFFPQLGLFHLIFMWIIAGFLLSFTFLLTWNSPFFLGF